METLNNTLATNIRVAMAKENISTTKLHLLSGVSRSSITEYRKGNIKQVNLESLSKIAGALNVKVSALFLEGDKQ
ncbi:helix-turn-helix domain-containing protein [Staphylococcus gallinarum]|uniref:helix-turn-helix domain-containing protein n=1 Tax=Staphylococcus gallinarum TaxID=1293 RepID=UPI000D1E6097|nr:helix-turn-helix transcriptional regulator [Staphylococcus gallinarum]PTK95459.1 XRE family transcriptional regulator [Staphylococcus gallinarum]PTK96394.1 XRE family transcriptional regulator [Staphylococcus gallinarum]